MESVLIGGSLALALAAAVAGHGWIALLAVGVAVFFGMRSSKFSVRRVIVGLLDLHRRANLLVLRLRGVTEEEVAAQRLVDGTAWAEFCDTLKAAGAALVSSGTPRDAFNQAEGHRYLTRVLRAGLMAFIEHSDPKAPVLHRVVHETVKMGSDNPDNFYQTAALCGRYRYRLYGTRGTISFLSFGTQRGHYGQGGGLPPTGYIEASQLHVGPDGKFEVILSQDRPADANADWLPMDSETGTLVVRQSYLDRATEIVADLHIERIDDPTDARPSNLTAQQVDEGLRSASTIVAGASMLFARWANGFRAHGNKLPRFDPAVSLAAGGDPNIAYYHSYWQLKENEALVVEVKPPTCEYWNFQINNYWMESLDYRYHTICINKHTAKYEKDGSVIVYLAHRDPGHPNWLTTAGHDCGTMCWRWVKATDHPEPPTRVITLPPLAKA
eukprot:m.65348 g.65348  ORF g.65348 m.65348 type:complete len:441 (+) comp12597_c1_seq2:1-1323(+)